MPAFWLKKSFVIISPGTESNCDDIQILDSAAVTNEGAVSIDIPPNGTDKVN